MSETVNNSLEIKSDAQNRETQLSKSDIFGILQNDRRRCVLEILRKQGNQSIRSLSDEIARLESGEDDPKSTIRKSIYVSLLQTHIPKMESLGVVNYDRENDFVELLPAASDFDIYMETVKKGDIPWSHFYIGLSTLAIVGSVTIYLGLLNLVTSNQWILFISSLFMVASIAHMRQVRKL
ncbi:hypothetical protein [Methanosarcina sp.]|uniref:DUF7344 domain-containing protein n=1 Tax=Methanosarcina sp. TaxID=2213 RepID=UPI002988C94C|nr:hypothetical protein [Methanosarcina sp.]MDW5549312.1 hypothetical protein [Methanosarcina sp.]MDW5553497.1 hypothetical protein [Methanosarcina sp.]MDW5559822.1 hypothetical protein [Methanosarcina sp.]